MRRHTTCPIHFGVFYEVDRCAQASSRGISKKRTVVNFQRQLEMATLASYGSKTLTVASTLSKVLRAAFQHLRFTVAVAVHVSVMFESATQR
jgi:hypothetical protein